MGGAARTLRDCLPAGEPAHHRLVEMEAFEGSGPSVGAGAGAGPPRRASIRRDMDQAIQRQVRIIKSREDQIRTCERQVLRYGKVPGEESRRWAVHHYRRLKRQRMRIQSLYSMLEAMQTLRAEMHQAEDMADAYEMFSKYSKEFEKVVMQLRTYDVATLMNDLHENMESLREIDSTVETSMQPEAIFSDVEFEEYTAELAKLEARHARDSLDAYLYGNEDVDRTDGDADELRIAPDPKPEGNNFLSEMVQLMSA